MEGRIPFFNEGGKRKTKMEVRIPFSHVAGKRLALKYTHSLRIASRQARCNENACIMTTGAVSINLTSGFPVKGQLIVSIIYFQGHLKKVHRTLQWKHKLNQMFFS